MFIYMQIAPQWSRTSKPSDVSYTITCNYLISFNKIYHPISIIFLKNTSIDSFGQMAIHNVSNISFIFHTNHASILSSAQWIAIGK